jgi:hypothetical protein
MFTLDTVVPWGRSFGEFRDLFALSDVELRGRILDCAGGPASFAAEASRRGTKAVSVDPLYRFGADEIRDRIAATSGEVIEQTRRNAHQFVWKTIGSPDELYRRRLQAMELFLGDFERHKSHGRYVAGALPSLPLAEGAFDVEVCSHFLFLYSEHLGGDFHQAAVAELCRVARDVRIFPLLALGGVRSRFVDVAIAGLDNSRYRSEIVTVPYEFQKGGNEMLRITRVSPTDGPMLARVSTRGTRSVISSAHLIIRRFAK